MQVVMEPEKVREIELKISKIVGTAEVVQGKPSQNEVYFGQEWESKKRVCVIGPLLRP